MVDYRADFPILSTMLGKRRLVYLDNAATTPCAPQVVEAMLPFLRSGKKRLGLITSATASIREPGETRDFAFAMTQAGLHMLWKLYFNKLRPEGFTFRVFCPCVDGTGLCAGQYMQMDFCYDAREEYIHSEENRIVMRDGQMREISW